KAGKTPFAFFCIATDLSTRDSLGPLLPTNLSPLHFKNLHLYRTLSHPLHPLNLKQKLPQIQQPHGHPFIVTVHACLPRL
ncbi:DUF1256 domain-containing protein, partial [Bacillus sp. WP8]|uniref:DUF1256 domain-containing protein n=1 Tax=Bacillus sp. WP8 TaxID=756828 RepID=UPI0011A0CB39